MKKTNMNIVWFSWKDRHHPEAGGAETVSGQIMDRLVRDGHSVTLITARYKGAQSRDTLNGTTILRKGNKYTVYLHARKTYKDLNDQNINLVIDEMNTLPFAAGFYSNVRSILLSYQLAREVWFYQITPPLSIIGYLLEPMILKIIQKKYSTTLTESQSSKSDLERYGFKNVRMFKVGMELLPVDTLGVKDAPNTILSLGAVRPMKRTLHAIKAFEVARDHNSALTMIIAGDISTDYAKKVIAYIKKSRHSAAIDIRGRVSYEEKLLLMRKSGVILVTSIKEGWGLIVTEANSQGTPAIAYSSDGLKDSIKDNNTGILCTSGDYSEMGLEIIKLFSSQERYDALRKAGWEWSKDFTFENSYRDFIKEANIK